MSGRMFSQLKLRTLNAKKVRGWSRGTAPHHPSLSRATGQRLSVCVGGAACLISHRTPVFAIFLFAGRAIPPETGP